MLDVVVVKMELVQSYAHWWVLVIVPSLSTPKKIG
jgi:hypothetical protein